MRQTHKPLLFTSRSIVAVAALVSAISLINSVRDLVLHKHAAVDWFFPIGLFSHRWLMKPSNLVFYGLICWCAYGLLRASRDLERAFLAGWFTTVALWPVRMMLPQWDVAWELIGNIGVLVAFCSSLTLLLSPPGRTVTPSTPPRNH